jgi:protein-S-isoprenylcysteine O-methyltransferase Ste14
MAVTTGHAGSDAPGAVRRREARARLWDLASKIILVAVYLSFAVAHFHHWHKTGELSGLGLVVTEGLFATLFLLRRTPKRSSSAVVDWAFALGGSWLAVFDRPGTQPLLGLGTVYGVVQVVGTGLSVLALSSLGCSFGVVAADRGIKTGGMYRCVRHPVYAAYLVTQVSYLLQNPTLWNLAVILAATACQIGWIRAEERMLIADSRWRDYAERVRYRLVPRIF